MCHAGTFHARAPGWGMQNQKAPIFLFFIFYFPAHPQMSVLLNLLAAAACCGAGQRARGQTNGKKTSWGGDGLTLQQGHHMKQAGKLELAELLAASGLQRSIARSAPWGERIRAVPVARTGHGVLSPAWFWRIPG